MSGCKNDSDKPIAGTVLQDFGNALTAVSVVGTFGAKKYAKSNWLKVESGIERYTDAMARHFLIEAYQTYDPESNIIHAAHTAWNALARLELMLRAGDNIMDMGDKYYEQAKNDFLQGVGRREGTNTRGQVPSTVHHSHQPGVRDPEEDFDEDIIITTSGSPTNT